MSLRRTVVASLALVALAASPSFAATKPKPKPLPAPKPLSITDPAGDANGINGQGESSAVPSTSTAPAQRDAADIVKLTIGRMDDGKQVTGVIATMTLTAAPAQGTTYRITGALGDCASMSFAYSVPLNGAPSSYLRFCDSSTLGYGDSAIDTSVSGSTITWKLPVKAFPAGVKLGTVMGNIGAHTRADLVAVTAPVIDEVPAGSATYKFGQ